MQQQVQQLVQKLLQDLQELPPTERLLVGICGVPGSGKTNLAVRLVAGINKLQPDAAVCVSMDGWHYNRSTLSSFPNAKEAFDRRGAEWTFDAARFADFVTAVKRQPSDTLRAPSFDHARKDPVEDDIVVEPYHRVVVFEGLYCNCNIGNWKRAAQQFDSRLAFHIDLEEAKQRLVVRHVATGLAKDEAEAIWRADNNDLPNGEWLMSHLLEPYTIVYSIDDPSWK